MKKYLAKQDPASSPRQLQAQLDRFSRYYNEVRPHRAKGRRTPAEAFSARVKATPTGSPETPYSHYRIRRDLGTAGVSALGQWGDLHRLVPEGSLPHRDRARGLGH